MSLAGHVLWGWLFTTVFGASFTVTKLSVVVLHVLELFVMARWLRWCDVANRGVWLVVLALAFHPLHFTHCYTYDTDIPAITWQLVGLWLIALGLRAGTNREPRYLERLPSLTHRVSRCESLLLIAGSALIG